MCAKSTCSSVVVGRCREVAVTYIWVVGSIDCSAPLRSTPSSTDCGMLGYSEKKYFIVVHYW